MLNQVISINERKYKSMLIDEKSIRFLSKHFNTAEEFNEFMISLTLLEKPEQ